MSFLIRTAIESDAPAVSELIVGLSEYFSTGSISQVSQKFWDSVSVEAVTERIASPDYCCFVAEDANGLSGFVAFRNPSHLFHLFVAAHAQSQGLGKLLWQKVLDRSACSEITVNSSVFAIPFYQRLGFTRVDVDKTEGGISYSPLVFTNDSWQNVITHSSSVGLSKRKRSMEIKAVHKASCHCGAVELELTLPNGLDDPRRCDCSMCRRRGAIVASVPLDGIKIIKGEHNLSFYQFNTMTAKHFFCSKCGIYTHHQRRSNPEQYGFNVACLEEINLFELSDIPTYDGVNHPADRK